MLRILGSKDTFAGRWTRRDMLRAGGLGLLGATLGRAPTAAAAAGKRFGQAKACIILYLYGAPSQLELFDPKPDAPLEVRGQFRSIQSTTAGLRICEHLPRLARVIDTA